MDSEVAVGFWSYTHEDDRLDGGGILRLSHLIMEEYDLLSGEPLKLFIDRNDIAWGEEWRKRVDSSLAQTTFFIPIITPRYFTRPECRSANCSNSSQRPNARRGRAIATNRLYRSARTLCREPG